MRPTQLPGYSLSTTKRRNQPLTNMHNTRHHDQLRLHRTNSVNTSQHYKQLRRPHRQQRRQGQRRHRLRRHSARHHNRLPSYQANIQLPIRHRLIQGPTRIRLTGLQRRKSTIQRQRQLLHIHTTQARARRIHYLTITTH